MRYVLLTRFLTGVNDRWQLQLASDDLERLTRAKLSAEKHGMIACVLDTED